MPTPAGKKKHTNTQPDTNTDTTTVNAVADLELETVGHTPFTVGGVLVPDEPFTFDVTVKNHGPSDNQGYHVQVVLPSNISFVNNATSTETYTLSLHDALPISYNSEDSFSINLKAESNYTSP